MLNIKIMLTANLNVVHTVLHTLLLIGVRCARSEESEDTLSVQRPQTHTTNPWKEEKDTQETKKKE